MSKRNIKNNCASNDTKKQKTALFNLPELTNEVKRLKNIFEQLNVFCAFCSARLTEARLTFEGLKKAVPDLTIEELAGVNVVVPSFIHFEYEIDQILEIDFGPKKKKKSGNKPMKTDAIKKIIDDNQRQFLTCLDQFLHACKEKAIDPDTCLKEKRKEFIPILPPHTILDEEGEKKEALKPKPLIEILDSLKKETFYSNQLVEQRTFPNKIPKYGVYYKKKNF